MDNSEQKNGAAGARRRGVGLPTIAIVGGVGVLMATAGMTGPGSVAPVVHAPASLAELEATFKSIPAGAGRAFDAAGFAERRVTDSWARAWPDLHAEARAFIEANQVVAEQKASAE